MQFGIALPHYTEAASVDAIVEVAQAAEDLGFSSVWVSDHLVYPDLPQFSRAGTIFEPLTVLSFVAAKTRTVSLGTSVLVAPHRSPIVAAKSLATLDALSGGRLVPCFGTGGIKEEFEALGLPWGERGPMTDDFIRAMRELWTSEPATYHGQYVSFDAMKCLPKPVQNPLPVWVGGNTPRAIRRAVELGDGWHPIRRTPEVLAEGVERMRILSEGRGRAVAPEVCIRLSLHIQDRPARSENGGQLRGTPDEIAVDLDKYRRAGAGHVVLDLLADVPSITSDLRRFAEDVRPQIGR